MVRVSLVARADSEKEQPHSSEVTRTVIEEPAIKRLKAEAASELSSDPATPSSLSEQQSESQAPSDLESVTSNAAKTDVTPDSVEPMEQAEALVDPTEQTEPAVQHIPKQVEIPSLPDEELQTLSRTPFYNCLSYLHRKIQQQDVDDYFAEPVTDEIAPGYSDYIKQPMDFSTMKSKLDANQYTCIPQLMEDVRLICENAMEYNANDTVYYEHANRILAVARKLTTTERLVKMYESFGFMRELNEQQLGFNPEEELRCRDERLRLEAEASRAQAAQKLERRRQALQPARRPQLPIRDELRVQSDEMSREELLDQARKAVGCSTTQLTLRQSQVGVSRRRADGSTSLGLLNPDNDGMVSSTERIATLRELVPKPKEGTSFAPTFQEDKRNKAIPVTYLNYGAFASYLPSYDSSTSTISKADSDLILASYPQLPTDVGQEGEYVSELADGLIDVLSAGTEPSLWQQFKQEEKSKRKLRESTSEEKLTGLDAADISELSAQLSVDLSGLENLEKSISQREAMTTRLTETSELLSRLSDEQTQRLAALTSGVALRHAVAKPNKHEQSTADELKEKLKSLVKQVQPNDVRGSDVIRRVLGVVEREEDDGESVQSETESHTNASPTPSNNITTKVTSTEAPESTEETVSDDNEAEKACDEPLEETDSKQVDEQQVKKQASIDQQDEDNLAAAALAGLV